MIHYLRAEDAGNVQNILYNIMLLAEMDLMNGDRQITFKFVYDYELEEMERQRSIKVVYEEQ